MCSFRNKVAIFVCPLVVVYCGHFSALAQQNWSSEFKGIGTFSSPRICDLNGDGFGDVVLGAGRDEFKTCDSAVIALDGVSGKMLWHVKANDQVFGSAALKDVNLDGTNDVIIGGRSAVLMAINGKNGKVLWRFDKKSGKKKWYGFYNPQFISDVDGDSIQDILTSNGGNVWAEAHSKLKRPPGTLVVISAKNGNILARAEMPDGNETYMSVSALPVEGGKDYRVIFGTGGETIGGHLYVTSLSAILSEDLSQAKLLDSSPKHGYIAPAVWIDITKDNIPDVVANAVEGKLIAFDGNSYAPLWSAKESGTEAYSSVAPGYFTDDRIPDFFVSFAVGTWPNLEWSRQLMVDGATGKTLYVDSLGFYQTSTPVVFDMNGDDRDEVFLSVNIHVYDDWNRRELNNMIVSIDFKNEPVVTQFTQTHKGSNISTTPWIGDLDHDGMLDIIYCHETNVRKTYTFDGMRVHRVETKIPISTKIPWGSYMGSNYDGVFKTQ